MFVCLACVVHFFLVMLVLCNLYPCVVALRCQVLPSPKDSVEVLAINIVMTWVDTQVASFVMIIGARLFDPIFMEVSLLE